MEETSWIQSPHPQKSWSCPKLHRRLEWRLLTNHSISRIEDRVILRHQTESQQWIPIGLTDLNRESINWRCQRTQLLQPTPPTRITIKSHSKGPSFAISNSNVWTVLDDCCCLHPIPTIPPLMRVQLPIFHRELSNYRSITSACINLNVRQYAIKGVGYQS